MINVFLADAQPEARLALRLLLLDLNMQVVGEAADWSATLTSVAKTQADMIIVVGLSLDPHICRFDMAKNGGIAVNVLKITRKAKVLSRLGSTLPCNLPPRVTSGVLNACGYYTY